MPPAALAVLLLAVTIPAPALRAQSVDPRLYDATLSPGALIGLSTAWVPSHLQAYFGLATDYANDELNARNADGDRVHEPLGARWVTTLGAGLGLFDRLELEADLPFDADATVGRAESDAAGGTNAGLGDLRVAARVALVREGPTEKGGFGLALQCALFLPTGGDAPFSSDGGLVADPRLVVSWRGPTGFALAAQVGFRARPERRVVDLTVGDELRYGAGFELPFGALGASVPLALVGELEGALGLARAAGDPVPAASGAKLPLEARLGLRAFGPRWDLTLATGFGLDGGYGAPDLRFVAALTFAPGSPEGPRPEPPARTLIAAAAPSPHFAEAPGLEQAAVFDEAMREDPDGDGDGIPVPADQCPDAPEDFDGHDDADGCPDPDNDSDGIPDAADRCPDQPETPNGIDDDDGCPDQGNASVVAKEGTIELTQTIEFMSGSDVLAPSAAPILAEIAAVLKANPWIKRVRIEGHTDDDGDSEMNVDLSERRAGRVRQKLVALGVDGSRLLPKGYGATRAIADNRTPEGRKKNRRVDFRVIDPPPPGAPHVDFDEAPK